MVGGIGGRLEGLEVQLAQFFWQREGERFTTPVNRDKKGGLYKRRLLVPDFEGERVTSCDNRPPSAQGWQALARALSVIFAAQLWRCRLWLPNTAIRLKS
jgi:hypothetical protein